MIACLPMLDTTSRGLRKRAIRERMRRKRRRLVVISLALVLVFSTFGYGRWRLGQIASVDVPGLHSAKAGRPFNVLVVGSDSANTAGQYGNVGGQRNDVTMV